MDVQKEYTGPEDGCWLLTLSVAYWIFILILSTLATLQLAIGQPILKMFCCYPILLVTALQQHGVRRYRWQPSEQVLLFSKLPIPTDGFLIGLPMPFDTLWQMF
jgi:hypothetical protein